jgi:hypothetical protein
MFDFLGFEDFFLILLVDYCNLINFNRLKKINRLNGLEKNLQIRENQTFKAKNQIKIVSF